MEPLQYEKIRWPIYKDLIYRRRDLTQLPLLARQLQKMVSLKDAPPDAKVEALKVSRSVSRTKDIASARDTSSSQFKLTDQKAADDVSQSNAAPMVSIENTVMFDGNFECSNID